MHCYGNIVTKEDGCHQSVCLVLKLTGESKTCEDVKKAMEGRLQGMLVKKRGDLNKKIC